MWISKIRNKKLYIITIVIALLYMFIFSRILFPTAPEYYRLCYIDNKVDKYGSQKMYIYTIGKNIDMNFLINNNCLLSRGWSYVESDGVWSNGSESQICLYFNNDITENMTFKLNAQYLATGIEGKVKVNINNKKVASFSLNDNKEYNFKIKTGTMKKGYNFISFHWPKTYNPGREGESDDDRELCIKMSSFEIDLN